MDYHAAFQVSATGMAIEKLRLETTARNIANMNIAAPSAAQAYKAMRVVGHALPVQFAQQFGRELGALAAGGVRAGVLEAGSSQARMVHEPGHPYADAQGMVAYPAVNHTEEMLILNTALRAYEANVVAMNAAKTMAARTLEIGGQQ